MWAFLCNVCHTFIITSANLNMKYMMLKNYPLFDADNGKVIEAHCGINDAPRAAIAN